MEDSSAPEPEDCFKAIKFADGSDSFTVQADQFVIINQLLLPEGLTCEHCVLRWHYRAGKFFFSSKIDQRNLCAFFVGNSWGICEDGTGATGCGDQETFRSCSDITIVWILWLKRFKNKFLNNFIRKNKRYKIKF